VWTSVGHGAEELLYAQVFDTMPRRGRDRHWQRESTHHNDKAEGEPVTRPVPRRATVLYAISATCAVIGALLWVRSQTSTPPSLSSASYGSFLAADAYTSSAWRVWSPTVPEERLGLYLVAAGLVLAVAARLFSIRRD
jgi:hypothetical protein